MTHAVITKFRQNYRGFWRSYRWLIIIFIIALLCDAAGTIHFMLKDGANTEEVHPVINLAAKILGPVLGPLFGAIGKAFAGLCVAIYCRRFAPYILITVSVISFWAGWFNVWGNELYVPNIFKYLPW